MYIGDLLSFFAAHHALLLSMWPSEAWQELPPLKACAVEAKRPPYGGCPRNFLLSVKQEIDRW